MKTAPLIMVVEDEPSVCEFIALYLREEGLEVVTASDGLEALKLLQEHQPATIILDVMMPRMDGLTLLRELERTNMHTIPVIMYSANRNVEKQVASSQIVAFLAKPFDLDVLLKLVDRAIDHSASRTHTPLC